MSTVNTETKPNFTDVPVDALEQLRMRLSQLVHSLNILQAEMSQSQTMQNWSSLQNQLAVILSQLSSLSSTIDKHMETLQSTDAFPVNNFPTSAQEGLLTTLLRKKNLPEVNSWINDSLTMVENISLSKDDKWCGWCLENLEQEISEFLFSGIMTKDELVAAQQQQQNSSKPENGSVNLEQTPEPGFTPDQIYKFIYQNIDPRASQART